MHFSVITNAILDLLTLAQRGRELSLFEFSNATSFAISSFGILATRGARDLSHRDLFDPN